jgi:hypothetical protein
MTYPLYYRLLKEKALKSRFNKVGQPPPWLFYVSTFPPPVTLCSPGVMYSFRSTGISSVDKVLKTCNANTLNKLFPSETRLKSAKIVKAPLGQDMVIPSQHNMYKITLSQLKSTGNIPQSVLQAVEELKALPEVEYAEPNYIFTDADFKPERHEMTFLEAIKQCITNYLSLYLYIRFRCKF